MTLLLSSTKIQVLRPVDSSEVDAEFRTEDGTASPVGSPVVAHISSPTGNRSFSPGGSDSTSEFKLLTDLVDLRAGDLVRDLADDRLYSVDWAAPRRGFLPHLVAGISATDRIS